MGGVVIGMENLIEEKLRGRRGGRRRSRSRDGELVELVPNLSVRGGLDSYSVFFAEVDDGCSSRSGSRRLGEGGRS